MRKYLCLVALLSAAAACQKSEPARSTRATRPSLTPAAPATTASTSAAAAPTAVKPVPAKLPEIVARVNGEPITLGEFQAALREYESRSGSVMPDTRDAVYRGVLDDLIALRLLNAELDRRKMEAKPAELEEALRELRGRFPNEKAYRDALAEQNLTPEQLRDRTRRSLLINQLIEQEVGKSIAVKPSEVATFYEQNPSRFTQPESVRVSHILIGVPANAPPAGRESARQRAAEVTQKARAGADFAALARQYSNDASRTRGGDLGFIVRGQAQPPFEQAAFTLAPGQISDPIETVYGFHIIKGGEKRPSHAVPFGQAAAQVEQYLLDQKRQQQAREYVTRLKSGGKVEILI